MLFVTLCCLLNCSNNMDGFCRSALIGVRGILAQRSTSILFVSILAGYTLHAEMLHLADVQPRLVTSDGSGTHVALAGEPVSYGGVGTLDHDGVARIFVSRSDGVIECTGSLLPTRRHILTAAHCLTNNSGVLVAQNASLSFGLEGGSVGATAANFFVHPAYDGQVANGFDLAIIELSEPFAADAPSYDIFRGAFEPIGELAVHVGYGRGGIGSLGETLPEGTKRTGLNQWDAAGLSITGINNTQTQLTYDFDSGLVENDAFAFFLGDPPDLGTGADEVIAGLGDSGGPSFLFVNDEPLIAGITSYGFRLSDEGGSNSDVDGFTNASWGEFAVDTDVAELADWVDSIIPEPRQSGLAFGMLALLVVWRRRRAQLMKTRTRNQ